MLNFCSNFGADLKIQISCFGSTGNFPSLLLYRSGDEYIGKLLFYNEIFGKWENFTIFSYDWRWRPSNVPKHEKHFIDYECGNSYTSLIDIYSWVKLQVLVRVRSRIKRVSCSCLLTEREGSSILKKIIQVCCVRLFPNYFQREKIPQRNTTMSNDKDKLWCKSRQNGVVQPLLTGI